MVYWFLFVNVRMFLYYDWRLDKSLKCMWLKIIVVGFYILWINKGRLFELFEESCFVIVCYIWYFFYLIFSWCCVNLSIVIIYSLIKFCF